MGRGTEGISVGLGSTATTPLIIALLRRGHSLTLYTLGKDITRSEFHDWGHLRIFVGPARIRRAALNFFKPEIDYLSGVIKEDRPAFVHAHWTYEFALGAIAAKVPSIVTIHDLPWNVLRYFRDHYRALRLLMSYAVAFRGSLFTAVSQDAANHFRRYLKPGADIKVIPNGLRDEIFKIGDEIPKTVRSSIAFGTILQGWSSRKNGTAALVAFSAVRRELPSSQLLMFGVGYEPGGEANQWAARKGLDDGVIFAGVQPYQRLMERVHEEVDIVVHPSLDESFSMAALEGMALGKAVIAGRSTPGVREVLGFGSAGVLTDVKDPAALALEMLRLARDPRYREDIAAKGRTRALATYRMDAVVAQYEALYKGML